VSILYVSHPNSTNEEWRRRGRERERPTFFDYEEMRHYKR
jgi:hypothetical protein